MKHQLEPSSGVLSSTQRNPWPGYVSIVPSASHGAMPTSEELSTLVQAVAKHADRQAFAVLFKHFAPRVKNLLMRAGSNQAIAEELVQDTMVQVWRKAALYDASQAAVSTWIYTIARNLRVDQFPRLGAISTEMRGSRQDDGPECESYNLPDPSPPPEEQLHAVRMEQQVRAALTALSEDHVQVLRVSFFEDYPHAAIARELGLPLGTVKSRVRRAVHQLRQALGATTP